MVIGVVQTVKKELVTYVSHLSMLCMSALYVIGEATAPSDWPGGEN